MNRAPLRDAMGGRFLAARWVIQGQLTLKTALHLGGSREDQVDMPILRDGRKGIPLLPGTTFAGALRSALADQQVGFGEPESNENEQLFGCSREDGGRRNNDEGVQSPLIVFDALGELPTNTVIETRDGVAISPSTGIAEDHKKYDFEVLPAGTTFPVRVDLLVPGENHAEAELLVSLAVALDAFSHGESGFGARRTRGLGRTTALWTARRYDLRTRAGWLDWARSEHEPPLPSQLTSIDEALKKAGWAQPTECRRDARSSVRFDLDLQLQHDILVRSTGADPSAPDVSHLRSGDKPILPGTALAGVLRTQALRIANLVRSGRNDAEKWVDRLFGPRFEGQRAPSGFEPRASRLRIAEAQIRGSDSARQARIAIDRFTQGVVDGALFEEQPEVGGDVRLMLELRNPNPGELGLVVLVLKDLLSGRIPVGGTSNVGRGFLMGSASVAERGDGKDLSLGVLRPGEVPTGELARTVSDEIKAFRDEPSLVDAESTQVVDGSGGQA